VLHALRKPAAASGSADELAIGGTETTVVRPLRGETWSTLVLVPGATELGRRHPRVVSLAHALARVGNVVVLPDLPRLGGGEVTEAAVASAVGVAQAVLAWSDGGSRLAIVGVSVGGTVALLAAEEPELEDRVSVVAAVAPYTDLVDLIRLATTGHHRDGERLVPYDAGPFLSLSVARSVCAGLPAGEERRALAARLAAVDANAPEPLACLAGHAAEGEPTRAALRLLLNRDPARFEALYAAMPDEMRAHIERLSPVLRADRLGACRDPVAPTRQVRPTCAGAGVRGGRAARATNG
jgi:pimeloyl-ACP methyl ester carboxylesterase